MHLHPRSLKRWKTSIQHGAGRGFSHRHVFAVRGADYPREPEARIHDLTRGTESFAEALTYLPDLGIYSIGPETYLEMLQKIKAGSQHPGDRQPERRYSTGGWMDYARKIEQAGADALELNLYYLATDPDLTSAAQLEDTYITLVSDIRKAVSIPLAVKLSPFFTSLPNFARRLVEAGANGLVLFNRFYQPDFDLEELEVIAQPGVEQLQSSCACRCAGSPSCTGGCRPILRSPAASTPRRTSSSRSWQAPA